MISVRGTYNGSGYIFMEYHDIWDAGLLYGYASTGKNTLFSIATGLSVAGGSKSVCFLCDEKIYTPAIGIPLNVQISLRPLRAIGLGLYGFANINPEQPFAGTALIVQLGKLR